MKPLLLLVVFIAVTLTGCKKSERVDPYAKYRDAQLKRGMTIDTIKQQFGEPDKFQEHWSEEPDGSSSSKQASPKYPYHVQSLNYGAFGTHNPRIGHHTNYRLSTTFVDGELYDWYKSTPVGSE